MVPLTKILLPIDYSERCLAVARHAIGLAEHFGSEITVLRVLPPVSDVTPGRLNTTEELLANRRKRAGMQLNNFAGAELRDVRVRARIREGDPAAEILIQAAQDRSDLIMMPTHGFSAFRQLLLGSVAAKCLHKAVCPVWMGPHGPRASNPEPATPGHIVCALTLGSERSKGLEWAAGLAGAFHSALTILHLAPRMDLTADECCEHPWRCHVLTDGLVGIPHFGQAEIVSRQILVEAGDVSKAVSVMSQRLKANLLVLDHSPRDKAHLNSVEYEIIRASACATLRV